MGAYLAPTKIAMIEFHKRGTLNMAPWLHKKESKFPFLTKKILNFPIFRNF